MFRSRCKLKMTIMIVFAAVVTSCTKSKKSSVIVKNTSSIVDVTAPAGGVFEESSGVTLEGFTLHWTASQDGVTPSSDLEYLLCSGETAASIGTVKECLGSQVIIPFKTGVFSAVVSGKPISTKFYFNVVVKDAAGNMGAYGVKEQSTFMDVVAPTPGAIVSTPDLTTSNATLRWTAGSDDIVSPSLLEYYVCSGDSVNDVDTSEECLAAAKHMDWTANVTSKRVVGLEQGRFYALNVLVRDTSGNVSAYQPIVGHAPSASSFVFAVSYLTTTNTILSGTDADGDAITYVVVSGPSNGVLSGLGENKKYTPNAGFFGVDSFTYKVHDGILESPAATVTLNVSSSITIYLRSTGSDSVALDPADASTPALTAQRAINVAFLRSPSVEHPVIIDVGYKDAGHFGNIVFYDSPLTNISWIGVNSTNSQIGSITGYGSNGTAGYLSSDEEGNPFGVPRVGDGLSGPAITITADSTVSFGNISSIGGIPGDPNGATPEVFNTGSGGSIVTSTGSIVGNVTSQGGTPAIAEDNISVGGSITIRGTAGNLSSTGSCGFDANVTGCASGGDITVHGQVGNVTSSGQSTTVLIASGATATDVFVQGLFNGNSAHGGIGGNAIVNGTVGNVIVSGYPGHLGGGHSGTILVNAGSVTEDLTAQGANGLGENSPGGDGGSITYSLTSTTGAKSVDGGLGVDLGADGADGTITAIP